MHENYFKNIEELKANYKLGSYKEMFTLKNTLSPVYFSNYLEEVILDNPKVDLTYGDKKRIMLLHEADKIIKNSRNESSYDYSQVKFCVLENYVSCYCTHNYINSTKTEDLERYFLYNGDLVAQK
ncbi:hypothetical protein [Psychrobacillus sp. NPDC096389]|uniref:hypothetical protein n=1 Tax=Psychrobacillus sp. NPDC096389 TaxID=3364490 RepID=UPI0037FCB89F